MLKILKKWVCFFFEWLVIKVVLLLFIFGFFSNTFSRKLNSTFYQLFLHFLSFTCEDVCTALLKVCDIIMIVMWLCVFKGYQFILILYFTWTLIKSSIKHKYKQQIYNVVIQQLFRFAFQMRNRYEIWYFNSIFFLNFIYILF